MNRELVFKLAFISLLFCLTCGVCAVYGEAIEEKGEVIDKIVAVVGTDLITQSDLERALFPVYGEYRQRYEGEELARKMDEARREILNQMIDEKVIINAANDSDIEVSDQEVDEKIEEVKQRFNSEEEFIEAMNRQDLSIRSLKKDYREEILKSKLIDAEVKGKMNISFKEVNDYYQDHLNDFIEPEKVKAKAILIKPAEDTPEDWEEALAKANEIFSELEGGASFENLAKQYSDDVSASQLGDMGFIDKGYMTKEIDEVLFSLTPQELSQPVKTKLGYYIFKLEDKEPQTITSLKEAEIKIKSILFVQKFNERFKKWIKGLKEDAYISIK